MLRGLAWRATTTEMPVVTAASNRLGMRLDGVWVSAVRAEGGPRLKPGGGHGHALGMATHWTMHSPHLVHALDTAEPPAGSSGYQARLAESRTNRSECHIPRWIVV